MGQGGLCVEEEGLDTLYHLVSRRAAPERYRESGELPEPSWCFPRH